MSIKINIPYDAISEFCLRNGIKRLSFFGSVLRDDFGPESDVDVLVEFQKSVKVGLRFFSMEMELSEILGRKVDLNTPGFINPHFRDSVIAQAEVAYAA